MKEEEKKPLRVSDEVVKEMESINAEIRQLTIKRTRLLVDEATRMGLSPEDYVYNPQTAEFVKALPRPNIAGGPLATKPDIKEIKKHAFVRPDSKEKVKDGN